MIALVTGCGSVPASIKSQRVGKMDLPVRDLAVVFVEGQGTARLGLSTGGKLAEELQRQLAAAGIPGAAHALDRREGDLDERLRAAMANRPSSHQLVIIPWFVLRENGEDSEAAPIQRFNVGFMLSEISPPRLVWRGDASFVGRPPETAMAAQLIARLKADGMVP